jgi:hypothetical protein
MSQPPTTPVKVPSAAASYTPATLDPDLRSQLNTILLRDGHVAKIQESLLHALNSHSSNWPSAVQSHALSLLRSGEVTTYSDLLRRVLEDVRSESSTSTAAASSSSSSSGAKSKSATNGKANGDATPAAGASPATANGSSGDKASLALPTAVVEEAIRVTRESLEAVCEIEENSTA